jgi:hypothetical protein
LVSQLVGLLRRRVQWTGRRLVQFGRLGVGADGLCCRRPVPGVWSVEHVFELPRAARLWVVHPPRRVLLRNQRWRDDRSLLRLGLAYGVVDLPLTR